MSLRSSYHLQIISSVEGMFVILHHGEQQSFGHFILSVVRLPPVQMCYLAICLQRKEENLRWIR